MFEPTSSARQLVCFDSVRSRWRGRGNRSKTRCWSRSKRSGQPILDRRERTRAPVEEALTLAAASSATVFSFLLEADGVTAYARAASTGRSDPETASFGLIPICCCSSSGCAARCLRA
jgi:hypothetical protein